MPVFGTGRWWTVLSASWLHGGLLHIIFNVMWIRQLGPSVGELYGPGRMVIIYVVAGACGFLLSSTAGETLGWLPIPMLQGGYYTVGASASIFGLLGSVVYYGRRSGSSMASSQAWNYALPLFLFGFIMPGIDNYAHAGGFIGGYLMGRWSGSPQTRTCQPPARGGDSAWRLDSVHSRVAADANTGITDDTSRGRHI